jgi:hypothetical protein
MKNGKKKKVVKVAKVLPQITKPEKPATTRLKAAFDAFANPSIERIEARDLWKTADKIYTKGTGRKSNLHMAQSWGREVLEVLELAGIAKSENGAYIKTGNVVSKIET